MALSNWDLFAVNQDNKPSSGEITTPAGVTAQIYKNWVYIQDAKAWRPGCRYIEPTIMEISEGILVYQDLSILAKRGPQEGVYVAAYSSSYSKESQFVAMVGVGCYGYTDDGVYIGATESSIEFLKQFVQECLEENIHSFPDKLLSLDFQLGRRMCQGDRYFMDRLESSDDVSTKVGEASDPILSRMMKG